jgi:hypothetical protein
VRIIPSFLQPTVVTRWSSFVFFLSRWSVRDYRPSRTLPRCSCSQRSRTRSWCLRQLRMPSGGTACRSLPGRRQACAWRRRQSWRCRCQRSSPIGVCLPTAHIRRTLTSFVRYAAPFSQPCASNCRHGRGAVGQDQPKQPKELAGRYDWKLSKPSPDPNPKPSPNPNPNPNPNPSTNPNPNPSLSPNPTQGPRRASRESTARRR